MLTDRFKKPEKLHGNIHIHRALVKQKVSSSEHHTSFQYYDLGILWHVQPSVFDNGTLRAIEKRNAEIVYYFEAAQSNLSSNSGYRAATNVRQWEVRGDKFLAFKPFQEFSAEEVKDNAPLLTQLGYSEEQIGAINKRLC